MEVDIIISIAIAAVILFTIAQGSRIVRAIAMHKTLRKAIEQGQPLSPETIERLDRYGEDRSGWRWCRSRSKSIRRPRVALRSSSTRSMNHRASA